MAAGTATQAGRRTVETRQGLGALLALSIIVAVGLSVAAAALVTNAAAWPLVAGSVILALGAGVYATVVADRLVH
ncbi:MAG: hypothetical protein ACRDQA_02780 [Nocardioidaceae bacterium]